MATVDNLLLKTSSQGMVARVAKLQQMKSQDSDSAICDDLTGWPQGEAVAISMYQIDSTGIPDQSSITDWIAEVNNNTLFNMKLTSGVNRDYDSLSTVVVVNFTSEWANRLISALLKILNQDGTLKTGVVDGKALKAGSVSNGHIVDGAIDSKKIKWRGINGDRLADNSVDSRVLNSASFAKIQYVETPNTDLEKQYEYVYTPKITIPKAGKYLIIASYQTQNWKNGLNCDINMKIVKDSAATNPQDVNIDYANFKSAGFHDGMMQKVATLSANDKVRVRAEIGQAVPVQISVRLSVVPVGMF